MNLVLYELTKVYGEKLALDHVSFSFYAGLYGILGPNGAGKSTMMNLITDNLKPTEGRVLYNEKEITSLGKNYLTKLGYMPQQEGFYDAFSGRMFLSYMAEIKGVPRKQANAQIEKILERVNLQDDAHRKISEYSGGMQKRLMLGQALLGDPKILLLDEPTAGLDPVERIRLRNYIHELSRDRIILFSTHIVSDIQEIADQVLMMKDGRIVKSGPIRSIIQEIREELPAKDSAELLTAGREETSCGEAIEKMTLEQAYLYVMGGGRKMTELRRLLLKPVIFALLITAAVISFFFTDRKEHTKWEAASAIMDTDAEALRTEYLRQMEALEGLEIQTAAELLEKAREEQSLSLSYDYSYQDYVREVYVTPKLQSCLSYPKFLEKIRENEESYQKISLFSKENPFTLRNIRKTDADYQRVSGVQPELQVFDAIEDLLQNPVPDVLILVLCLCFIFLIPAERRNHLLGKTR